MVKRLGIVVQAHMGSTRLKNKMLKSLGNRSVIGCVIERLQCVRNADELIIATSDEAEDDVLVEEIKKYGVKYFRGSNDDVLGRFWGAATHYDLTDVMRICADNVLQDWQIIEQEIECYRNSLHKIVVGDKSIPLGIGGELFPMAFLEEANLKAAEHYQREHVTPYIYEHHTDIFRYSIGKAWGNYRLTLDTEEDWQLIQRLYDALQYRWQDFVLADVIHLLEENPGWVEINKHVKQKTIKA